MNPYVFESTCDLCGGKGVGTINNAVWDGHKNFHKDRNICYENLKLKANDHAQ